MKNSFGALDRLKVSDREFQFARLEALESRGWSLVNLPYCLKILLENLLRREDDSVVPAADIEAVVGWDPKATPSVEIAFMPARVLLQDFTGVPAIVDLAAMRDALRAMGGDPKRINPLQPAELVIDHSVQVDEYGSAAAFRINKEREFERNRERYGFLKWGQQAFDNFRVVPPGTGIVHQVNLEYLGRVIMSSRNGDLSIPFAYPDTLVGTDSHTTMINGLGILGWGVGGIEAEAVMLGQPISMLVPQVLGFRLTGELAEGATATDLVLTVTQMLRERGVVGKFVEYFGSGLSSLPLADRATIANMAPEYGATCGIFPIDQATLDYLHLTGRASDQIDLVEAYAKEQGLFHTSDTPEPVYSDTMELDLSTVQPSMAGPKRPQDRILLGQVKESFLGQLEDLKPPTSSSLVADSVGSNGSDRSAGVTPPAGVGVATRYRGEDFVLDHGSVVIAAITSCTNTSNPTVMVCAGLLARNAVKRGLRSQPWVKTSLAPGSKVVTDYLDRAGLTQYLENLGFHLVGYGCTTCIGNSGPLPEPISKAIDDGGLVVTSVLSGNRNFEGRISTEVRANYLASPPLVVAFALTGRIDIDLYTEPLGEDQSGAAVYLKDLWPSSQEISDTVAGALTSEMFTKEYGEVFLGDERWGEMPVPLGDTYAWEADSTYVKLPPYFDELSAEPPPVTNIVGARVLALVGDSITTDHISPAGAIKVDSPAGKYLMAHGVEPKDFNSYGSRRGNHEVMMRGTFANVLFRNQLVPGKEGGFSLHIPSGTPMTLFDAAMRYKEEKVPLIIIAGEEYGTGSSRDWAAKGPSLLGVRAVIAGSYERIHRSNLIGMGILPLEFKEGDSAQSLGLTGHELYSIDGLEEGLNGPFAKGMEIVVRAQPKDGAEIEFSTVARLDTPQEAIYFKHGGILQYVLRQMVQAV